MRALLAGTVSPSCARIQPRQSGHQLPLVSRACAAKSLRDAAASSLVSVALFGVATSASYAVSSLVDWPVFAALVAGGAVGAQLGLLIAPRLAVRAELARQGFALMVVATAVYVGWRALSG